MAVTITKKPSTSTSASTASKPKKPATNPLGAPAQHTQSSRKGKKAWRKHVDLAEVEEGLERLREDIRTTGGPLSEKKDGELFLVDVKGDEGVRKKMGKPLKSLAILSQRSAVPAVHSRPPKTASQRVSREVKERLLRKAGKHMLYSDRGEGAGLSEAAKRAGGYDAWGGDAEERDEEIERLGEEGKEFVQHLRKRVVKAPKHADDLKQHIHLPAITAPHQGQSYNPSHDAHAQLLLQEHEKELASVAEMEKEEELKRKFEKLKALRIAPGKEGAMGMKVDGEGDEENQEAEEEEEQGAEVVVVRSTVPKRKTRQQRLRYAKHLADLRALNQQKARKRLLASLSTVSSLSKAAAERQLLATQRAEQRKLLRLSALQDGLAGKKLGKHVVPHSRVDLQLGDELAETLRELRPEGNLLRERYESLQQRGRAEPGNPVGRREKRLKEKTFERHSYKRFV